MLTDEQATPEQIQIFRRMTPEQRWRAAHRLYWTMRRHKCAFVQSQHPHWSEQQVMDEVRRIFSHARTGPCLMKTTRLLLLSLFGAAALIVTGAETAKTVQFNQLTPEASKAIEK